MYLLFAVILYLKAKGIEVDWYWYALAFVETLDVGNLKITLRKDTNNE